MVQSTQSGQKKETYVDPSGEEQERRLKERRADRDHPEPPERRPHPERPTEEQVKDEAEGSPSPSYPIGDTQDRERTEEELRENEEPN